MLKPEFNILPEGARAGGLLPLIIAVMIYLCGLALFAALALQVSIAAWSVNLDRSFTVQIPADAYEANTLKDDVDAALNGLAGIATVDVLTTEENTALLETWLGEGNVTEELPVPAIIDIKAEKGAKNLTATAIKGRLSSFEGVQVDQAGTWLAQLRGPALALITNAYFILFVVIIATVAVVIFGTRAQLAAHNPTILIVHHMGAEDSVIAREFQYSFLRLGLIGGAIGAVIALLTLIAIGMTMGDAQDGLVSIMRASWWTALILVPLPLLSALLTMVTARMTVFHALRAIP